MNKIYKITLIKKMLIQIKNSFKQKLVLLPISIKKIQKNYYKIFHKMKIKINPNNIFF
jgi:hypothetical protein